MSDEKILTTPPVHGGPDFGETHVDGAGDATKVGLASRIREVVERVGTISAARTSLPVLIPTRELVSGLLAMFTDVPRIPDYDAVAAHSARWTELEFTPLEVPDAEPDSLGVFVRDSGENEGKVCIEFARPGDDRTTTLDFEPDAIESFFLAGLAACAAARKQQGR